MTDLTKLRLDDLDSYTRFCRIYEEVCNAYNELRRRYEEQQKRIRDAVFNELHNSTGICGHCGMHSCAGRQYHSVLPEFILVDDLNAAFDAALAKDKKYE